jgi:predicted metal-dependent phosphoesterase TrpH
VIDLHTHTHHSDGLDSPSQLVENAKQAGVTVLGICDHDSVAGWAEAENAARSQGIGLVQGIEVSTHSVSSSGRRISVHVLAYLPDPNHEPLMAALQRTKESRVTRAQRMTELLAVDYPITWDEVTRGLAPNATIGRPALADALVRLGIVPNRSAAFESILSSRSKYYISEHTLNTREAIHLIRQAGGVPIMAHPLTDFPGKDPGDLPKAEFLALIEAGIAGFEIEHRMVPPMPRQWLRELAFERDLIVTGSSDYHGVGGKENKLGENSTSPQMLEKILEQATGYEALL